MNRILLLFAPVLMAFGHAQAQPVNRIDLLRPDAPELAAPGEFAVGVRTLTFVHADRPDIVRAVPGREIPRADRSLTVEVWYPAEAGAASSGSYATITREGTAITLVGRAARDAAPATAAGPFPLVIVSHGYPGNRYLLAHFGENLASKGYVVVAIDHRDSTYDDQQTFASTLYHRPFDQQFVLDEVARRAGAAGVRADGSDFLAGLVDADRTGVIGYSMGGYGLLNLLGAGFTAASVGYPFAPPGRLLAERAHGDERYPGEADPRIRAAIAIAPWGRNAGFWDAAGLAAVRTPLLLMAGSVDDVSGYETGVRAIFDETVNAERYLLTFEGANHNAAAPIPAPYEAWRDGSFDHYADAVWDTVRMNNIAQHFATAYFDLYLKGDSTKATFLDLVPYAADGVWSVGNDGRPTAAHSYWKGFPERSAVGLRLEHAAPAENR